MKKYSKSFRWRIALPFTLLSVVALLAIGISTSEFIWQIHLNNLEISLIAQSKLVAELAGPSILDQNDNLDSNALRWADLLQARVTIIGLDGTVLGESQEDREEMDNHLYRPEIQQTIREGFGVSMRYSQTAGIDMLYASAPIEIQGEVIGFSRVALPLTQVQTDLNQFRRNMLIFSLSMVAVAIFMGIWFADRITQPIKHLSEVVREIAGGNLSKRLYSNSQDEIGQLTKDIDIMTRQLNNQFEVLQSEESKLSAILEQMTDGVVMVNQKGEVVLINHKAFELFQLSSPLPASRSLIQVLGHYEFVELWQRCVSEGKEQSDIVELYSPRRFIQGVATSLDGYLEGNILLIFQDLTSVRRLETVRRDFISNISHELRTPLASLKALAETLQAGAVNDPPAATRFISQIEIEVDALNQMTSELLELARIESQQTTFEFTPTPSCLLLGETTDRLTLQAQRAGVSIHTSCPSILPDIMADQIRLEQVFVNLIHNAIKFTPPGGEILVSAEQVEDTVQYTIRDNGRGIPEKDLPRIFERFYKTDKARSGGGTGLGLAIAKHIVEAHGGKIWAESKLHQGSTFYFRIPAIIEMD